MTTNPIEELVEKKLASKKKIEIQVEDAKDSLRRATNKLEEKSAALARRSEELETLEELREQAQVAVDRQKEINEWFKGKYELGITLDEYNAMKAKDQAAGDYWATPNAPEELHETMKEFYTLPEIIEETVTQARKVFYNR